MSKLRVGVLRGGPSSEYEVSLLSGKTILQHLDEEKYDVKDIFIDRNGSWHLHGRAREPADILDHIDLAFLGLHGEYGEDGKLQRMLDQFGIPYTGSGAYASTMSMHKAETKNMLKDLDVLFARHRVLGVDTSIHDELVDVIKTFSFPMIVKPARGGSSVGLSLVKNKEELAEAVRIAFEESNLIMIEEYIEGREATCGVVENFRGEDIYALLPIEIIPASSNRVFDYDSKYSGQSKELCPAPFNRAINGKLEELAKAVHKELGLRHYSRSDFIVSEKGIYFLEVNTLPGMTEESLLPKSVKAIGSSLKEFLDHIVSLAKR
jgi:D-alanine-D-alanine ligase